MTSGRAGRCDKEAAASGELESSPGVRVPVAQACANVVYLGYARSWRDGVRVCVMCAASLARLFSWRLETHSVSRMRVDIMKILCCESCGPCVRVCVCVWSLQYAYVLLLSRVPRVPQLVVKSWGVRTAASAGLGAACV